MFIAISAQRTLDANVALDDLAQLVDVGFAEITNAQSRADTCLFQDVERGLPTDAEDVRKADLNLLVAREIDAGDASHVWLALTLLVLGIALADDASHTVALNDLAVLTNRLHAAANFHGHSVCKKERYLLRPDMKGNDAHYTTQVRAATHATGSCRLRRRRRVLSVPFET